MFPPLYSSGGNALCMDSWIGFDSGPFMHTIHFSFGIGAFIAPIIAEPFLK
jgi:FHS family Na+ dependent glucose MFS transporter 1